MKWINLWKQNFADFIYIFNLLQQRAILHKSKKYQGIKEKKHDFEMSVPSCRKCCTIMVHLPIVTSCSISLSPGILSFCPKSL